MTFETVAKLGLLSIIGLLGLVVYETSSISDELKKAEEAGRIMQDSVECESRCPPMLFSKVGNDGQIVEPDNSPHDKCSAECEGSMKEQFKRLLSGRERQSR